MKLLLPVLVVFSIISVMASVYVSKVDWHVPVLFLLLTLLAVEVSRGLPQRVIPFPSPAIIYSAAPGIGVLASSINDDIVRFYNIEVTDEMLKALQDGEGQPIIVETGTNRKTHETEIVFKGYPVDLLTKDAQ